MRSGACYQREPLELRTDESAGGSSRRTGNAFDNGEYPTPSATPYGSSQNEGKVAHKRPTNGTPSLETWAKGWEVPQGPPTPRKQAGESDAAYWERMETEDRGHRKGPQWPTPRALSGGPESAERKQELGRTKSGGGYLQAAAQSWATPTAGDSKASGSRTTEDSKAHPGTSLTDQIHGSSSGRPAQTSAKPGPESRPRLNPRFVEGLMGLPPGWTTATASDSSETASSPSKPPSPSGGSPAVWASMGWAEWSDAAEAELDRLDAALGNFPEKT